MLRIESYGPVTRVDVSRSFARRPVRWASAYVLDRLLIDSGPPATAREMVRFARERGVNTLVHTHGHEDHVGADWWLGRVLSLVPCAPAATLPALLRPPRIQLYRRLVWGVPRPVSGVPLGDDFAYNGYRFRVVPTPGHSPDHVCLYEPERGWLFGGDLFLGVRVKYLRADENANEILASVRQVIALNPETLFCSHAGIVTDAGRALQDKVDYWSEVQTRAAELRRQGRSLPAIRDAVLGPEGAMRRITLGHFSKLNLIRSLLDAPAGLL